MDDLDELAELDELLRAMAHPVRRAIVTLVWEAERTVGDIVSSFDLAGPSITEHLKVLRKTGLLRLERDGTRRLYLADRARIGRLRSLIDTAYPLDGGP